MTVSFVQRISRLSRSLAAGAGSAAWRFPVAVLLVVAFAILSNLVVADALDDGRGIERVLAALSGAAAVSVAVTLGLEGRSPRPAVTRLLSALVAAGLGLAIWLSRPFPIYAPALLTACVAAIPLAPYLGRGSARAFWTFTLWTAVGVVLAFLSVLVFLLGVTAILEMVRYLFRVGFGMRAYEHLFTTALTLIGPLFALGRIPLRDDDHATFQADDRLVRTVRPLFDWVSAPLALATALVLHVYVGRILATGEVPRGEIGWIVCLFSALVICLRIAMDPFLESGHAPARLFGRLWAWMLVVPLGLLAYAIEQRVTAEGFTAARYFLALTALAIGLVLLAQVWPRLRGDIRILGWIPVILLATSTFGPWGVAETVGRSQQARIRAEVGAELLAGPSATGALPDTARRVLRSRLRALEEVAELGRIRALVAPEPAEVPAWQAPDPSLPEIRRLIGLGESEATPSSIRTFTGLPNEPIALEGYDRVFTSVVSSSDPRPSGAPLATHLEGDDLVLTWSGVTDRVALAPTLAGLPLTNDQAIPSPAFVIDLVSAAGRHLRLRVEQASTELDGRAPTFLTATILVRSAEWGVGAVR